MNRLPETSRGATVAVTVTYGKRGSLVKRVADAALRSGVAQVVIVDNGAASETAAILRSLHEATPDRIVIVEVGRNSGSAVGFGIGIAAACRLNCEFIWLLDDDNAPEADALQHLYRAHERLGSSPKIALCSFRNNQEQYVDALMRGTSASIPENSFQGFHWRRLIWRIGRKLRKTPAADVTRASRELVKLDMSVYGGFWFSRSLAEEIGLPDRRYFVYCDDFDYTLRVAQAGGAIYLCAASRVVDLDAPWSHRTIRSSPWISPETSDFRVYFSMRNHVYFERRFIANRFAYRANRLVYMTLILLLGLLFDRDLQHLKRRHALIRRAIVDGEHGRLGPDMPLGFRIAE